MKPTVDDIEAMITTMIGCGPADFTDSDAPYPTWWITSYDPEGNERGTGTDMTMSGALAAAWIFAHGEIWDRYGRVPLTLGDFDAVPRHVPDGWTFEVVIMPAEGSA